MKPRFLLPAVFLLSAVGIAYELALMRIFSAAQWYHFAYMVIGVAMLGMSAAGTGLALVRPTWVGREAPAFRWAAVATTVSVVGCYEISQRIPFETFELVSRPSQWINLLTLYVVLSLPFFFVSTAMVLAFALRPHRMGQVYSVNLLGSGLGAVLAVTLMRVAPPADLAYLLAVPAGLAALCATWDERPCAAATALALGAFAGLIWAGGRVPVRVSPYKVLAQVLRYPEARVIASTQSPMSWLVAVSSDLIRETPGQVSGYSFQEKGPLPRQVGLFFDGGALSVVNECPPTATFEGSRQDGFAYLDYVTAALPYQLLEKPSVLVLGAGGGTDILMALTHGAAHVTAVEVDPAVAPLMRGELRRFSGGLFDRPEVTVVTAEGRGFLEGANASYDLIQIGLLDTYAAASAGVYALNESYLYTREALTLYLNRLTPRGVLAITRWIKTPPRDEIRVFATLVEALEAAGIRKPAEHVAFIRSWNTATLLAARRPLSADDVARLRRFCDDRSFDLCWLPGLLPEEVNRYTVLEKPVYYDAARALLSREREMFYRNYLFDVRPASDDRPYFFQFFKWSALGRLLRGMGVEWVPFVEWGYLALVATGMQAAGAGAALALLPLWVHRGASWMRGARWRVGLYFAALGFGYMFLEVAFIQRFVRFLSYPVYAVSVVLAAFLVFSGLGSALADRLAGRRGLVAASVGGLVLTSALCMALTPRLFVAGAGWPDFLKIAASLVVLAPLAVCMGIPGPAGLQVVSDRCRGLIPWAWAINGACSVVGASLATLVAVHFGFRALLLGALMLYGVALVPWARLEAE